MMTTPTGAAGYPDRPVRVLVPFPPGGSTEFTARTVAQQLQKILGQPFRVENKVGEFGIAALRELLDADAHTLLVGSVNTNSIAPIVFRKKMPFDYQAAVTPVSRLAEFPSALVIQPSVPAGTLPEFIAYVKKTGGKVRNGTDWIGSYPDIDGLILGKAASLEVVNVAKPGGADGLLAALVAGEIDMLFLNVRTAARAVQAGQVKPLAVTGPGRVPTFPDVPTMGESGYENIGTTHWHGLFAPSRTPVEIVRLLHGAARRALDSDEARSALGKAGARAAASASPEQFAAEIRAEMAGWERVTAEIRLVVG